MRLLNTHSLRVAEFLDDDKYPPYAILSHTWGRDEVSLQDIQDPEVACTREGFAKVDSARMLALSEGFEYIWIDTCCIDKTSSSELSEAINSMYLWYRMSTVCYAYLADVTPESDESGFCASRWFTRGWTLQELIAPPVVAFYSSDWQLLGFKSQRTRLLSQITGIDTSILTGGDISQISVARKMSWAADRQTRRVEDVAYSLLGIFSVNMPLIYGEGKKAFIRLQEEIIKATDDQSIFAWTIPPPDHQDDVFYGLLAESPAAFRETGKHVFPFLSSSAGRRVTTLAGDGVRLEVLFWNLDIDMANEDRIQHFQSRSKGSSTYYKAVLDCPFAGNGTVSAPPPRWRYILLWPLRVDDGSGERQFARVNPWMLDDLEGANHRAGFMMEPLQTLPFQAGGISLFSPTTWADSIKCWRSDSRGLEAQSITVPHRPRQKIPLGFQIVLQGDVRIRQVYPRNRWSDAHLLLRRDTKASQEQQFSARAILDVDVRSLTTYLGDTQVTRTVEGIIVLIGGSQEYINLVIGLDFLKNGSWDTVTWNRAPWCRLQQTSIESLSGEDEPRYQIDWTESQDGNTLKLDSGNLSAVVNMDINGSGVYEVSVSCVPGWLDFIL